MPKPKTNVATQKTPSQPRSGITAAAIRAQVERIVKSPVFSRSERMKRFLQFAVEQTLADAADDLKEYTIGLEVFDKPAEFDPRLDPIVRVEAGRLRSKIRDYYSGPGAEDEVGIEFPKRSYVPVFELREQQSEENAATTVASPPETQQQTPRREVTPASETGSREGPKAANSIAVLPFADLNPKQDQQYFCDGITEEIVNALGRAPGLRVAARTSVMKYKGTTEDVRDIGAQLGVGTVLEGSVRRADKRIRIAAQLVNVTDGYNLWSDAFDFEMEDVFEVQSQISESIVGALQLQLAQGAGSLFSAGTTNSKAYQLYLQGRHQWARRSPKALRQAIRYFERAIELDAGYALANTGLADCYSTLGWLGSLSPEDAREQASAFAQAGLRTNPSLSEVHSALGFIKAAFEWNLEGAEESFRRAIALDPRNEWARSRYAMFCLAPRGLLDRASEEIDQARDLDPVSPMSLLFRGWIAHLQGRHAEALRDIRESMEVDPSFVIGNWHCGFALIALDRADEALKAFEKMSELGAKHPLALSGLACGYAALKRKRESAQMLKRLQELEKRAYVPPVDIAKIHVLLGDRPAALSALERAVEQRCPRALFLGVNPLFGPLRDEPRFAELKRRLQAPPAVNEGQAAARASVVR